MRVYRHSKTDMIWLDFTVDGKRYRRSTKLKYSAANMKVVEKTVAPKIAVAIATGTFEVGGKVEVPLFDRFADEFFEIYKSSVAIGTFKANRAIYNNHIKPVFKNKILKDIKPIDIEQWQIDIAKKVKNDTVSKYRVILYMILQKAFINQIIPINPMQYVPKVSTKNNEQDKNNDTVVNPFNKEDIKLLIENASCTLSNFIKFMYSTGMRPSEIIALTWSDIDMEKKNISISKAKKMDGLVGKPKTISSIRKIDMLPMAEEVLSLLHKEYYKYKHDEIFLTQLHKPYTTYTIISRKFKSLCEKLNINKGTLYNLRHTFASVMIGNGADMLWVSKHLGHKNLNITLEVYAKFIEKDEEKRYLEIKKFGTYLAH